MVDILRRTPPRDLDADRRAPFSVAALNIEDQMSELVPRIRSRPTAELDKIQTASTTSTATTEKPQATLPPYVQPSLDVSELGRLSGNAVVQQYEAAIQSLELLGKELIDCVRNTEDMVSKAKDTIKYIEETIAMYRSEAKATYDKIEHASLMTAQVRKICDDMRVQIGAPVPSAQLRKVDAAAGNT